MDASERTAAVASTALAAATAVHGSPLVDTAIRARGLRATPSRMAVVDVLQASEQSLSHADVAAKLDASGWDPATLYRNLMAFCADVGGSARHDAEWRSADRRRNHGPAHHPPPAS